MPTQAAPKPLESPAVRRSKYLADILAQTQQAPAQIQSGGELGARLLAQGLAQFGANRADRAVQDEAAANTERQRAALSAALGGGAPSAPATGLGNAIAPEGPGNSLTPVQSPLAPIAPVEASALPPAMPAQTPVASPNPMPAPQQALQQSGVTGPMRAQIELLMSQGDLAGATELFGQYQQQQALMANLPEELRNDPLYAWAAVNNPEALAESLGMRARPVTAAEGTNVITGGPRGDTVYNPRTFVAGGDVLQTKAGGGVDDVYNVSPTPADVTAQGRLALDERTAGYTLSPGQVRTDIEGGVIAQGGPDPQLAVRQQERSDAAVGARGAVTSIENRANTVTTATARARELLDGGFTGAGFFGGLPAVAGTPGADLEGQFKTIKSNLALQAIQELRNNSPTGGALGNSSDKDLDLLQNGVAALERAQSPGQIRTALDQIDSAMNGLVATSRTAFDQRYGQGQAQPQGAVPALPPGFRLD